MSFTAPIADIKTGRDTSSFKIMKNFLNCFRDIDRTKEK